MEDILSIGFVAGILMMMFRVLPIILMGATGEMISEMAGMTNIGLEGIMSVGSIIGFLTSCYTKNPYFGMLAGILAGLITNYIYAYLTIHLNADQIIVGNTVNILGLAVASLLYTTATKQHSGMLTSVTAGPLKIPLLGDIPIIGNVFFNNSVVVYISLILVVVAWFYLYKTNVGLALRAVGEYPRAAETLGIQIIWKKYFACSMCGMLCGFAGAYLTTVYISSYVSGVVSGRGYVALAAVIFGKWKPKGVLAACIFFSIIDALQLRLQIIDKAIPYQLLQMMPYLCTLIALAFFMKPGCEPKANGKPYIREAR
jgi:general nucleoside transport system permease protein